MEGTQKAVLAGLALTVFCLSACHHKRGFVQGPPPGQNYGRKDGRPFEVYIYTYTDPNGTTYCTADLLVTTLWKSKNQTVRWLSDDGNAYTVDFSAGTHQRPKTPFKDPTEKILIAANGQKDSGPLNPNADGYYDFVILDANNKNCLAPGDPGYYVRP